MTIICSRILRRTYSIALLFLFGFYLQLLQSPPAALGCGAVTVDDPPPGTYSILYKRSGGTYNEGDDYYRLDGGGVGGA